METSLRFSGGFSKTLRLHAKEKLPLDANTVLQVQGELDTQVGAPTYGAVIARHFNPELSADIGVGMQYSKREKFGYTLRAKKAFNFTENGSVSLNIKGRCDSDTEFQQRIAKGAAELTWCIFNFNKEQDVRVKIGYEVANKVPYMQIRENNWTLNASTNGRWNVRFDL